MPQNLPRETDFPGSSLGALLPWLLGLLILQETQQTHDASLGEFGAVRQVSPGGELNCKA